MYFIGVSFCVVGSATRAMDCSPYSRRGGEEIDSIASLFFQFLKPPRKETAFRLLPSQESAFS
jgi:hypothetical protein